MRISPQRCHGLHHARGDVDLAGFQLVQGLGEVAEGLLLRAVDVGNHRRHGAPGQAHVRLHWLDFRGQELPGAAQAVQDVTDDGGVQPGLDELEQLGVGSCSHVLAFRGVFRGQFAVGLHGRSPSGLDALEGFRPGAW